MEDERDGLVGVVEGIVAEREGFDGWEFHQVWQYESESSVGVLRHFRKQRRESRSK